MAIAFATKNPVQVHIMKSFYDLLHYGIKENLQYLWEDPANLPIIRRQHTEIFQAIKNHDPEAAYEAMQKHITFVLDFVRERQKLSSSCLGSRLGEPVIGRNQSPVESAASGHRAIRPPGQDEIIVSIDNW